MNPNLPADLLTSCLTTPIKMSVEWYFRYAQRERLLPHITIDLLPHLHGNISDRKSPFGELCWIFTAVTDTIAWCALPRRLFQKLFRQDILLVSLFRNFLLAERLMRQTGCHPVSHPALPELPEKTWNHYMWQAWDVAMESILAQLPDMANDQHYRYKPASFFVDQLTSFEIWIEYGTEGEPPHQLPCIIQGMSSPHHRRRSLELLARYLDLGPWAVNDALACGIMPYVMKLLANPSLSYLLVVVWVKILSTTSFSSLHVGKRDNIITASL
jgi:regulator-associated protein of mTOR